MRLTKRELEVLRLAAGLPSNERGYAKDIASAIDRSPKTVSIHLDSIFRKLNVHTRVGMLERAHELGLVGATCITGRFEADCTVPEATEGE
jgi:DNA-binding CsgD family transcriptional regulator